MSAAVHNIAIEQGAHFELALTVNDDANQPINLTGYTFAGQLRVDALAPNAAASFTFEILDQTASKGQVKAKLSSTDTAAIVIPRSKGVSRPSITLVYDIIYGPTGGEKYRLIQGEATVSAEVTR